MNTIPGSPSKRIPAFDLIKVAAMMYVIFGWHMDDYANNILATDIGRTLVIGALGMFIFVSGFTLSRSAGEISTGAEIWQFIKKRLIRIYPLYLSSLLLFLVTSEITARQFYSGLFLLNAILNIHIKTLWFVTMIFLFYLLLPLIIYRYSVQRVLTISALFLAVIVILNKLSGYMDLRLAYYYPLFVMGVFSERSEKIFRMIKSAPAVMFSVLVLAAVTLYFDPLVNPWFRPYYIQSCLVFSLGPLTILAEICVARVNMRIVHRLSYASFGMYLYHRFVFWVLLALYRPQTDILLVIYLFVFGFPFMYLMSERIQAGYDLLLTKFNLISMRQDTREVYNG